MKESYFLFYGKILGMWYELDESNSKAKEDSVIPPAFNKKDFLKNARKYIKAKKIYFNQVGRA